MRLMLEMKYALTGFYCGDDIYLRLHFDNDVRNVCRGMTQYVIFQSGAWIIEVL